jgi:hypothetical protein
MTYTSYGIYGSITGNTNQYKKVIYSGRFLATLYDGYHLSRLMLKIKKGATGAPLSSCCVTLMLLKRFENRFDAGFGIPK